MAQETTAIALLASVLLALPASGKDEDKKSKPPQAKQQQENQAKKPAGVQRAQGGIRLQVVPGGGLLIPGVSGSPLNLIRNAKVQEELKLDDDQKEKILAAVQAANGERRKLLTAARGLKGEERRKKMAEIGKKSREATAEATKAVRAALKPEQAERLDQISIQIRGIQALRDNEVARKLKLTGDQRKQIRDAGRAGQTKRTQLARDVSQGNIERAKYREKLNEIAAETKEATLKVLTEEQAAQFEKMKGEKFELPQRRIQLRAVPFKGAQPRKIQIQQNGKKIQLRIQPAKKA